jgi:hypothetical protein
MEDLEGRPLDRRYQRWGIGLCPSHPAIRGWLEASLAEVAGRYDLDGLCVDHARFPAPANLHSLTACGCRWCRAEADRMGFDVEGMAAGIRRLTARVCGLGPGFWGRVGRARPGLADAIAWLGEETAALDWLRFRARLLAERMRGLGQVFRGGRGPCVFGSDVFAPSIALLGGHRYAEWETAVDFITGGSSAGGVVGWATGVTSLAGEWGPALQRVAPGLTEETALSAIYTLFGCPDLGLPLTVEGLRRDPLPVAALFGRELDRLRVQTSGRVPLYPPVSAGGDPGLAEELAAAVVARGCQGAMLVLDPAQEPVVAALARGFGARPGG